MKLLKKKIELLPSTGIHSDTLPLPQPIASIAILHRTCKTLSLLAFIECYCNNDFTYLIIEGEPTPQEVQDAWNEIMFEYSGLIKNDKSEYIFDLSKRIALLQFDVTYIDQAIEFLHSQYDAEIIDILTGMGYSITAVYGTEEYTRQLNMVVSRAKTRVFELGELQDEFKRLDATTSGKKQTEADFNLTVAALSKHQGYRIDKKETSILEFTSIFNLYLAELSQSKKQAEHG